MTRSTRHSASNTRTPAGAVERRAGVEQEDYEALDDGRGDGHALRRDALGFGGEMAAAVGRAQGGERRRRRPRPGAGTVTSATFSSASGRGLRS